MSRSNQEDCDVEKPLLQIYQNLQRLTGLHRQLLDVVRSERENLVQADLKGIQTATAAKQGLIESIHQAESDRLKLTAELAVLWKKPFKDLTLPNIIIFIQGIDAKGAEQLRSVFNTLTILIQHISKQNLDNKFFLEKSLEHIHQMKKNVLGETTAKSNTYTNHGQKAGGISSARLISKEV
jgi:flagellar biosynthesis/type III secretory pathway chaperone